MWGLLVKDWRIFNTEEVKKETDFTTGYYKFWHPYRMDFGVQHVIVLQALASDAEEVSQSLTEDSTDCNRLWYPVTDFGNKDNRFWCQ